MINCVAQHVWRLISRTKVPAILWGQKTPRWLGNSLILDTFWSCEWDLFSLYGPPTSWCLATPTSGFSMIIPSLKLTYPPKRNGWKTTTILLLSMIVLFGFRPVFRSKLLVSGRLIDKMKFALLLQLVRPESILINSSYATWSVIKGKVNHRNVGSLTW